MKTIYAHIKTRCLRLSPILTQTSFRLFAYRHKYTSICKHIILQCLSYALTKAWYRVSFLSSYILKRQFKLELSTWSRTDWNQFQISIKKFFNKVLTKFPNKIKSLVFGFTIYFVVQISINGNWTLNTMASYFISSQKICLSSALSGH